MAFIFDHNPGNMAKDLYGDAAWDIGDDKPEKVPDITDPSVDVSEPVDDFDNGD